MIERVLISAGGTVTAQSIIKALREDGRASFVAIGDMDELNATRNFVDGFVRLPAAADPSFPRACLEAARRLRIDLFIPLIVEREFLPLDTVREEFARAGCRLWLPSREIVETIGDKLAFARFLEEHGIPGPVTHEYDPAQRYDRFPAYLKPRNGSGSIGTSRVENEAMLRAAAEGRRDLIVQEAVDGKEFTVDAFAAAPGRVVAAVPRERIAIKAGVSVKGRTYRDDRIENIVADVVAKSGVAGPVNVQGMLLADGSFKIFEMNPRFSGTLALTTASGINFASLLLDLAEGLPLPDLRGKHRAGVSMVRYWMEVFTDGDGKAWEGTSLGATREVTSSV